MTALLDKMNTSGVILLSLSVMLLSGFLVTRLTKLLRLPNVSAYILAGILIGPSVLKLVPESVIDGMAFVNDVALAFIAFGVGRFFRRRVLREAGAGPVLITLAETLLTGAVVTAALRFFFRLGWDLSLLLGIIAMCTAPSSTMMTIQQYRAQGHFVNTLLQTIALDNVFCLLAFSIATAVIGARLGGGVSGADVLLPVAFNLAAVACGALSGLLLHLLLRSPTRSQDNRLILSVALLLALSSLCAVLDISPLLSCMVFGMAYINLSGDDALFRQLSAFTPPIMSLFFIVSGMNLDIGVLGSVGLVGLSYFALRLVCKYLGSRLGCRLAREPEPVRRWLGLAMLPQAGVAVSLAFLTERLLPAELSSFVLAVILSSSVLYELVGPAAAKYALTVSGAIPREQPAAGTHPPVRGRPIPSPRKKQERTNPRFLGGPEDIHAVSSYTFDSCESLHRPPRRYYRRRR